MHHDDVSRNPTAETGSKLTALETWSGVKSTKSLSRGAMVMEFRWTSWKPTIGQSDFSNTGVLGEKMRGI